jgi:hypothetical protein
MPDKINWDGRADTRLRKLFEAGTTYREIADIFGCSQSAIAGRVHRLGLPMRCGQNRPRRAANHHATRKDPAAVIFLDGEPLIFAETGSTCARCGVREDAHGQHGCGQFAGELRVRER